MATYTITHNNQTHRLSVEQACVFNLLTGQLAPEAQSRYSPIDKTGAQYRNACELMELEPTEGHDIYMNIGAVTTLRSMAKKGLVVWSGSYVALKPAE